ncbi:MAG: hypothetical protein QOK43_1166 [Acidimicrobiaceae bacterium]|nr:hypothetical protein [Acidimicrobiaceae bacterium]
MRAARSAVTGLALMAGLALGLAPGARADCPAGSAGSAGPAGSAGSACPPPPNAPTADAPQPVTDTAAKASRLFDLVNQERAARGLPVLSRRADVDAIALAQGVRMAAGYDLWHNTDFFTPATHAALGAVYLGENVAKNASIEDMHQRLMASPHHRDNILDARFRQIGVGVAVAPNGMLFATEDFVEPRTAAAAAHVPAAAAVHAVAKRTAPAPSTTAPTPAPAAAASAPTSDPGSALTEAALAADLPGPMAMTAAASSTARLPGRRPRPGPMEPAALLALMALIAAATSVAAAASQTARARR